GFATKDVTVTITGTNDAPVIDAPDQSAFVSENEEASNSSNARSALSAAVIDPSAVHTASGAFGFNDVDLLDVHTAEVSVTEATWQRNDSDTPFDTEPPGQLNVFVDE